MAATDLIYNTTDPVLFTPDYSFLRYTLDKAQSRYDQGLDAVSRSYNNLKKRLTDPVLQQRRDQFLKDAEGQLKKIASSDLSLQENVNAANNVFNPLATDPAFIYDSYHTERINKQMAIMDDWANSTDPEIRKQYNPEIQKWVARDLNILRNGKGDINNYKGMHNRSAFAYMDAQDILAKAAKDYGYQFKVDSLGNPYIVTTEGGTAGAPSARAFANTVLGGNSLYQRQLQILSEAQKEDIMDAAKDNPFYAGKSEQEIYKLAGLDSYDRHRSSTQSYIDDLNDSYTKENASINAYINSNKDRLEKGRSDIAAGNVNTPEAQMFTQLSDRANTRDQLLTTINEQKLNFDQTFGDGSPNDKFREDYANKFAKDPQSFFADQLFKNDVQRFVDIKSSSITRTTKEDAAYVALLNNRTNTLRDLFNMKDKLADNARADEALDLKEQAEAFKESLKGKAKTKTTTNADGTTTTVTESPEISEQSASSYILYRTNALNKLAERVSLAISKADTNISGVNGGLNILGGMGLDNKTLGILKTGVSRQLASGDHSKTVALNSEEKEALQKAFNILKPYIIQGGGTIDDGDLSRLSLRTLPDFVRDAMKGYSITTGSDKIAKRSLNDYYKNINELDENLAAYNKGRQVIVDKYLNDPMFKGMFVSKGKDANGKEIYDLKGKDDIAKEVADYYGKFMDYDQYGRPKGPIKFSKERLNQIAEDYMNNTLNASKDGVSYSIFKVSPETYQSLIKKINEETPIGEFANEAGMMLAKPRYVVSGAIADDIRVDLSASSQSNSDIWEYASGTAEPTEVDATKHGDVRRALADKNNVAQVNVYTGTDLNKGGTSVSIVFKDRHADGSKGKEWWEGRELFFPITVNKTTPKVLQRFAQIDDVGDFAYYRNKGEDYVLDAFEADGIKAILHPNKAGDKEGWVEVVYKPYNEKTGKYSDTWVPLDPTADKPKYNEDVLSPNEIIDIIYNQKIYPYIDEVIKRKAAANQQSSANNSVPSLETFRK